MRTVFAGQDVWLIKYPSIKPAKARVTTVTESVAIAILYDPDGAPDHDRKQILKFPVPDALSACVPYPDQASAVKAWNAIVRHAIADATEAFNESVRLMTARLLPEPLESDTGGDGDA